MPPNAKTLVDLLNHARRGLNTAQQAVDAWHVGQVAGVAHTNSQRAALKIKFETGLQATKDNITAIDIELAQ